MRSFLSTMSLLLAAAGGACAADKPADAADPAVRSLAYTGKDANRDGESPRPGAIRMPFVQLADAAVARRIDDLLFVTQVGVLAPRNPGTTFAAADVGTISSLSSLAFHVVRHDARVLTIAFDGEGCGAYCENFHAAFTFDLRSGRVVGPDDLFTPAGQRALDRQMDAARKAAYRAQIASLGRAAKASAQGAKPRAKPGEGAGDDADDRVFLAQTCLDQVSAEAEVERTALESTRIEVARDALVLAHERCSNHASRALDDVDEVSLTLPYAAIRAQMTGFGRALLLGEGDAAPPDTFVGQVLYGTLGGRTPIAMRLEVESGGSVGGAYFYEKFGQPIELRGRREGDHLELVEHVRDRNNDEHDGAKIVLDAAGARLKGRWIGAKQFDVELGP